MKLILSILGVLLFIANYWVCEYLYPNSNESWDVFIPMDKLCHNFWAVILLTYACINLLKTKVHITNYFIYVAMFLSFFDVWARVHDMADYNKNWYILSLLLSFILSGIIYGIVRKRNFESSK